MNLFGVSPEKAEELAARMRACGLEESDLDESYVHGGGPGGQKVNKTASCVKLVHGPTGLSVKVQTARSRALNRFYARRRLCELLEEEQQGVKSPRAQRDARIRKQKSRRKRRHENKNGASLE